MGTKRTKGNKEVDIMSTATKLIEDEMVFAQEMQRYIEKLEKQSRECTKEAKKDARAALERTGVITKSGKTKKKIVSWE